MNGDFPHIAEWRIVELEQEYRPLNVRQELIKMQEWIIANPKRKKKNYNRFIINWLNRNHAQVCHAAIEGRRNASVGSYREPPAEHVAECERNIQAILKEHPELA